ncbi:MAG: hypothetical protein MUP60_04175, partial [Candidatus Thorarchaeota archaeon]|nr:hypothetical protein [Candidatus Thorarchaeota archaeon]
MSKNRDDTSKIMLLDARIYAISFPIILVQWALIHDLSQLESISVGHSFGLVIEMKIRTAMFTALVFALMTLPVALTSFDEVTHNVADFNEGSLRLDNSEGIRPETGIITSEIPTHTSSDGTLLTVYEYSEGTIQDRSSMSNESTTFYPQIFEIPAGWSTSSVTAICSEIFHQRNWITNSHFSDIANWYQQEYDPSGYLTEDYDSINDQITITRNQGGIAKYDYWGSWNQAVIINEGGTSTAQLNVSYRTTTTSGTNGQNAMPYLFVNGTLYELPTNGERFSVAQDWTTYSIDLPIEEYVFPGVLEIAVGIQGFANTQFQTTAVLYCDDILLTMETSRLAEVIDLRARDKNSPSNVVSFETGAGGNGYAQLTGFWSDQVELEFLANETSTEFTCDLYMPITMENHLLTNTYTVAAGSNATWLSEFTAREMPFPFSYWYFNVSIPRDWTIDFVNDPYDDIQLAGTTYYNATYDEISSVLTCD